MNPLLREDFQSIVELQSEDMQKLVNSNVIITGASGFVGKWLVGTWLTACESLGGSGRIALTCRNPKVLFDEFPEIISNHRVEFVATDIRRLAISPSFNPAIMIHAATAASEELNQNQPLEMIDVIVSGTRQALSVARQTGVSKFVFLSSGAVYGWSNNPETRFDEEDISGPKLADGRNAYHEAKRLAEIIVTVESTQHGFNSVILRPFTFLAPFLPLTTHFAAGNFVHQALQGKDIEVRSGGGSVRSYQYGADLVRFIVAATIRVNQYPAYNVGSPVAISIYELAEQICDVSGNRSKVKILGKDTPENLSVYVPSTSRIESEYMMTNSFNLKYSILQTIRYHQKSVQSQ